MFERHRAGVAGEVVGAGEDEDDFGLERDDVGAEADEHLRGGLAADAAVDVGLAGKEAAELGLRTQLSVMESPMKTTRFSVFVGGLTEELASW